MGIGRQTGRQPEAVSLQDLVLEEPEEKTELRFDPETEISKEDWEAIDKAWEKLKNRFIETSNDDWGKRERQAAYNFVFFTAYVCILDHARIEKYDFDDILSDEKLVGYVREEIASEGEENHLLENVGVSLGVVNKFNTTKIDELSHGDDFFEEHARYFQEEHLELLFSILSYNRVKCNPDVYAKMRNEINEEDMGSLLAIVKNLHRDMKLRPLAQPILEFIRAAANFHIIDANKIEVAEDGIKIDTSDKGYEQETPARPERIEHN